MNPYLPSNPPIIPQDSTPASGTTTSGGVTSIPTTHPAGEVKDLSHVESRDYVLPCGKIFHIENLRYVIISKSGSHRISTDDEMIYIAKFEAFMQKNKDGSTDWKF